jgi:thiol-disulfide isomerase/thioredoxin
MKNFIKIFLLVTLALNSHLGKCANYARSQLLPMPNAPSGIRVGEAVPDAILSNLVNFPSVSARLSDFKGKLLILDFWETWCKGCLESMPEVADLRDKFGSRVQFISITSQSPEVVGKFLARSNGVRNLHLTISAGDNECFRLFPHKLVPHVVWISAEGIYLGATSQADLIAANIEQILTGGHADFTEPKSDFLHFDAGKPLFQNGNGGTPEPIFSSFLTVYQPGLPSMEGFSDVGERQRFYAVNTDLMSLYCRALNVRSFDYPSTRIIYSDSAAKAIFRYHKGGPKNRCLFCYELIYPKHAQNASSLILNDLNSWLGLHVVITEKEVTCLVLERKGDIHLSSRDSLSRNNLNADGSQVKNIQGQYLGKLIDFLNDRQNYPPAFNETGYDGKVDMVLGKDLSNLSALNRSLAQYGIAFREERRKINMMVVSSQPLNQPNH